MALLKKYLFILLAFSLSSLTFSCSPKIPSQNKRERVVKLNICDEPDSLDPRKSRGLRALIIDRMIYEGLTRINSTGEPALALAERIDFSDDLKTYTIFLKKSLWADGNPVLSSDFIYAIKSSLRPDFPSDQAFQLFCISGAKGVKEGTLPPDALGLELVSETCFKITLEKPLPYFTQLLALPIFFPVNPRIDEPGYKGGLITNGPFQIKNKVEKSTIVLEKNNRYWDAAEVKLAGIEMVMVDGNTEQLMFEKGDLDWAGSPLSTVSLEMVPELKKSGTLHVNPLLGTKFIRVNVSRGVLGNMTLRQSLARTINRKLITEHILQAGQLSATGLVPPILSQNSKPYFQDADEKGAEFFQTSLQEMGLNHFSFPEITLSYYANSGNQMMAQAIQDQWKNALGINVKLESIEGKVYFTRVSRGDYDMALGDWVGDYSDPINFLEVFKDRKTGSNNTGWENQHYSFLLSRSSEIDNPAERLLILNEGEEILINEMPIIPLFHYTMLHLQNEHLKGVYLSPLGVVDFKCAYFLEEK